MNIESIRTYCLSKIGCTEDQAFGEDNVLFRVAGKIFACIDLLRPDLVVLKCEPDFAIVLRDKHQGIRGAWHWNKQHWNEVLFDSDVDDSTIYQLIDHSYELVVASLPQKALYRIRHLPADWYHMHIPLCDSALNVIKQPEMRLLPHPFVLVTTDYQTAGRGQGSNKWESQHGKNLLFALRMRPAGISAQHQFLLCQCVSVALLTALKRYLGNKISIKWPNDIYVGDKKIAGILIEHTLQGPNICETIIGIGLNVNQTTFVSDAPNPTSISLAQGKEADRAAVLRGFIKAMQQYGEHIAEESTASHIDLCYLGHLYRLNGTHPFRDANGTFNAMLHAILPNGQLQLKDTEGKIRTYAHKEVEFVIA